MYENIAKYLEESGSDKNNICISERGTSGHRYGDLYEFIINSQRMKAGRDLKILEIGIDSGKSLDAWSRVEFFSKVVGIDNRKESYSFQNPGKVHFYAGPEFDAYSNETIGMILKEHGKFDIIIDDGPHTWESQEWFFRNYNFLLSEDGIMICEDIKENYLEDLSSLSEELHLFVFDMRSNINILGDEIIAIRRK